jgi:hypothetical protein
MLATAEQTWVGLGLLSLLAAAYLVGCLMPAAIYARKGHTTAALLAFAAALVLPCLGWLGAMILALTAPDVSGGEG